MRTILQFLTALILMMGLLPFISEAQTHTYDAIGRLRWSTQPGGASTSFSYDPAGNILAVTSLSPGLDTNHNGIPDSYEIQWTGSPTGLDANGDPDSDSLINPLEFALARPTVPQTTSTSHK